MHIYKFSDLIHLLSNEYIKNIILFTLVALFAIFLLSKVNKLFHERTNNAQVIELLKRIVKILIATIAIITILGIFGIDTSALITGLGLTGFTVGFALKDTLSNMIACILLTFYRPFKIGDNIKVLGTQGLVKSIDMRYVTLTENKKIHLIPNHKLISEKVTVLPKHYQDNKDNKGNKDK